MKTSLVQLLTVDDARRETDTFLHDFLQERRAAAEAVSPAYSELWQAIDSVVRAGGKRLRPYMVALGYGAFSESTDVRCILPAMAAQELFHQAVLIHDDVIDRDDIRHGVPNVTGQYDRRYAVFIEDAVERRHFANSAALLAGDLLISSAFQMMQKTCAEPSNLRAATDTFAEAIFAVCGGELLDIEMAFRSEGRADARTVALHKTAHYSFVGPLVMGAQLANAPVAAIDALREYGEKLGIAFQIQDDILGTYGDSEKTGKSTSSDIREGRHTHLVEQFEALASEEQRVQFAAVFHNTAASDDDIKVARELLEQSGARAAAEAEIDTLARQALGALETVELSDAARSAFAELAERATKRSR